MGGARGIAWISAWGGESTIVLVFFGETTGPTIGPGVDKPIETETVDAKGAAEDHAKVGEAHLIDVGGVTYGGEVREEVVEEVVVLGKSVKVSRGGGVKNARNSYIWWEI